MTELATNRDLYLAIDALSNEHSSCERSLEDYLLALLGAAQSFADRESLTTDEFYDLISSAFTGDPQEFNDTWRNDYDRLPKDHAGYVGWRATLIRQIVDLREMAEAGVLENEHRYFGVASPRKSHWFNFDPPGYLECAAAGSFGGWEPGDETGRQFVPGPVAVMGHDGSIETAQPDALHRPTINLPRVTWNDFKTFIICGQVYE